MTAEPSELSVSEAEDFYANRLATLPSVAAVTSYVTMKPLITNPA